MTFTDITSNCIWQKNLEKHRDMFLALDYENDKSGFQSMRCPLWLNPWSSSKKLGKLSLFGLYADLARDESCRLKRAAPILFMIESWPVAVITANKP
jgi:hypothetical protein